MDFLKCTRSWTLSFLFFHAQGRRDWSLIVLFQLDNIFNVPAIIWFPLSHLIQNQINQMAYFWEKLIALSLLPKWSLWKISATKTGGIPVSKYSMSVYSELIVLAQANCYHWCDVYYWTDLWGMPWYFHDFKVYHALCEPKERELDHVLFLKAIIWIHWEQMVPVFSLSFMTCNWWKRGFLVVPSVNHWWEV